MKFRNPGIYVVLLFTFSGLAQAADPIVFPAKGQSNQQIEKDKFSCYSWAKQQSGFDPVSPPPAATAPAQKSVGGGVARGALGGAAVGAILGDSSKAAKRGAVLGGVVGGVRRSSANNKAASSAASTSSAGSSTYKRAFAACMEGKGYTVK